MMRNGLKQQREGEKWVKTSYVKDPRGERVDGTTPHLDHNDVSVVRGIIHQDLLQLAKTTQHINYVILHTDHYSCQFLSEGKREKPYPLYKDHTLLI